MNYKLWVHTYLISLCFLFFIVTYTLHDRYPNYDLMNKEYLIKQCSPNIVFAGDSRAERQLNVEVASKFLSKKKCEIVNVAISSGNPIMLEYLIDKYPYIFKNAIVILSISANQLNDNAIKNNYYTYSMISKLSYIEQLRVFLPQNYKYLFQYYYVNFEYLFYDMFHKEFKQTFMTIENNEEFGFFAVNEKYKDINISDWDNSPFYINYADGGLKYKVLENSLKKINNKVKKLYIYTAPFVPQMFHSNKKGENLLRFELSFKEKIKRICTDNNIECRNYLYIDELSKEFFYDPAHLNIHGSNIFTKYILKDFNIK